MFTKSLFSLAAALFLSTGVLAFAAPAPAAGTCGQGCCSDKGCCEGCPDCKCDKGCCNNCADGCNCSCEA